MQKFKPKISMNTDSHRGSAKKLKPFILAHISDLHLASFEHIRLRQLLNKRLLGYIRWHIGRGKKIDPEMAEIFIDEIRHIQPAHTVITGDLTHLGLPQEFVSTRRWLERLGSPTVVSVIPGNHDCYVEEPWENTFKFWEDYLIPMKPDKKPIMKYHYKSACEKAYDSFPVPRIYPDIAIIALSSACPSAPHLATGKIGSSQLKKLASILDHTGKKKLFRIICIHHPPLNGIVNKRKELTDLEAFARVVEEHGCEMVLHGHSHKTTISEMSAGQRDKKALVFGAPSLTSTLENGIKDAGWFLYEIKRTGEARFSLKSVKYRFDHTCKKFEPTPKDTFDSEVKLNI